MGAVEVRDARSGGPEALAGRCRFCDAELRHSFADLGMSPLANAYLAADELGRPETFYPLHAFVCEECYLVQLPEFESPEKIFGEYAYFSSFSTSFLEHARQYVGQSIGRFGLDSESRVLEVASNDGYLLQYFRDRGVPVLGVEPARNVAEAAEAAGIRTVSEFFGRRLARELAAAGEEADLVVANNVLAHVPDLNDFVAGLKLVLAPGGAATVEFPHLLRLIAGAEFDTIYHEHFSYFSFTTAERVFAAQGLRLFDVDEIPTHGGSLRIYACHADDQRRPSGAVDELLEREHREGLTEISTYTAFEERPKAMKRDLLEFLIAATKAGERVVGYGAAAKATTLLNYCGIRDDLVDYVVDRSPHKQGRFLPGSHLAIHDPAQVGVTRPDYLLLFAWNLKDEIMEQMSHVREFGCRFVVPIPRLAVSE
jgi:SAM-dependent methyltransferase